MKLHSKYPSLLRFNHGSITRALRRWRSFGVSMAFLLSAVLARGTTLTVTTNADTGAGSLRERIAAAAAGDVIKFDSVLIGQTIVLTGGELVIAKPLTLIGLGATNLTLSGNGKSRVLRIANVSPPITVSLAELTVTRGNGQGGGFSGRGGAIYNDHAILIVSNCVVSGSSAAEVGGGIYNFGAGGRASLTLVNSTVHGNSSVNSGGGIFSGGMNGSATATIRSSTISSNTSGWGGGVYNYGENGLATLTILNTTLSGNKSATSAGGIQNNFGTLTISHTLLAKGVSGVNFDSNGSVTNGGANLSDDDSTAVFASRVGTLRLGPLAFHGGYTPTHALLPGSPAIDAGSSVAIADQSYDQRGPGFDRIANGRADIGAYEMQQPRAAFVGITPQGLSVTFKGEPNETLNIEWNTDANGTGWRPLIIRATDATGRLEYTNPIVAGQPHRFYRAVRP